MTAHIPKILFDKRDHELIRIVNDVLRSKDPPHFTRKRYYPVFHPLGIKEMAESRGLRIAYAVAHLLNSLEIGGVDDRINALRLVRSEVLEAAKGPMPKNTARVLVQIMKELVRAYGDPIRQLALAHDFRTTATGKPLIVRRQLTRHHLLEMPEAWNQLTFDDHVHDVNTKGRKSPTHLIMDAWIKGIRRLRVIHYNFIEPRFTAELFAAAKILDVNVRIGIEFPARFRDKYVQLIWVPRGFVDTQDFLCFLAEPQVVALMEEGRKSSAYLQRYLSDLIRNFNESHRPQINKMLDLEIPAIQEADFIKFVGIGQKSKLHLAEFIRERLLEAARVRVRQLQRAYADGDGKARDPIKGALAALNTLDTEALVEEYLSPAKNPEIAYPDKPKESEQTPPLLKLSAPGILNRLTALHLGSRITLNLTNLTADEVLELLYDCQGLITRLELFNLKDHAAGKITHIPAIIRLKQAINEESVIRLKQVVLEIIQQVNGCDYPDKKDRIAKLTTILHDLSTLKHYYQETPLKARIGSDSTGRSPKVHGMGLAIMETLPPRTQRMIRRRRTERHHEILPIHIMVNQQKTYLPYAPHRPLHRLLERLAVRIPFLRWMGFRCTESWAVASYATRMVPSGNVVTLGGIQRQVDNGFLPNPKSGRKDPPRITWHYLNSPLKNMMKLILGFIPAFATFMLTKEWWFLAYFGAFIWFGITGLRNILQSVLGGGGFQRSPLMHWNDYVSWSRITDSLLFTGFSVPLLDYLVKTVILDRGLGIDAATNPLGLYTFMALANGIYLSTHNALRGLPKAAVYGNFFRSVLSIPIAVGLNSVAGTILLAAGAPAPEMILQKWAAIISKTASDCVAGVIEGLADRYANIRNRLRDYRSKFFAILEVYAQLELLYPDVQTFKILDATEKQKEAARAEGIEMERTIMLHALDLLYFWMYQPRAQSAFKMFLASLSEDERHIFVTSQYTLQRHREISQMFIDGIFGNNFPRPLSFYLSRYPEYLNTVKQFGFQTKPAAKREISMISERGA